MAEVTCRHEIACSADAYWDSCVFNDEFNKRLYVGKLGFHGFQSLGSEDTPERRTKRARMDPRLTGIPGPVMKAIGDRLSYSEDGYLDKKTKRYTCTITPSTFADKTKVTADLWCEPSPSGDPKKCVRVAKVRVDVKVAFIGGMVEDKIMGDLRASYDAEAAFIDEWAEEKGL